MLQRTLFMLVVLSLAAAAPVLAAASQTSSGGDGFGLGLIVGEPTGLSAKLWLSGAKALDFGVAWSFEGDDNFHLHVDYVHHRYDLLDVDGDALPVYFGLGGRFKSNDHGDDRLGIRIPIGLAYFWPSSRLEAFVEIVPLMDLAPDTDFHVNGGLGLRYFF